MALLSNPILQIMLVILAFYVLSQMMSPTTSEHMDTVIPVTSTPLTVEMPPPGNAQVTVDQPAPSQTVVTVSQPVAQPLPAEENILSQPEHAAAILSSPETQSAQANATVTSAPAATIQPAPLTAVEEQLLAAVPTQVQQGTTTTTDVFSPQATDYDEIFQRHGSLEPAELIPKAELPELYAGLKPDPSLNQNFLQNPWSLGITITPPKKNFIYDLRGARPNPIRYVSPWNNATQMPDFYRKSLADVS